MVKLIVFLLILLFVVIAVTAIAASEKNESLDKFCQCWLNRQRRNINTK